MIAQLYSTAESGQFITMTCNFVFSYIGAQCAQELRSVSIIIVPASAIRDVYLYLCQPCSQALFFLGGKGKEGGVHSLHMRKEGESGDKASSNLN